MIAVHGDARPRALDLFCGAGGATKGLQMAGFHVTGIDIKPQPRYCGDAFIQADAMTAPLDGYDLIWASPPCQAYAGATAWRGNRANHPDLIDPVQRRLSGRHYVIENVPDARRLLRNPTMLCGSMFGLRVRRHRYFETSFQMPLLQHPCYHKRDDYAFDHGGKQTESTYRDALGCEWMTAGEARQAIPPAYAKHIGEYAMMALESASKKEDADAEADSRRNS